jgi:hypothetical protein
MTDSAFHPCPLCTAPVRHWERYPRAICEQCVGKACDSQGQQLSFRNIDISGGFEASVADTQEQYPGHVCFIEGVECWADEARFCGIVIQPRS